MLRQRRITSSPQAAGDKLTNKQGIEDFRDRHQTQIPAQKKKIQSIVITTIITAVFVLTSALWIYSGIVFAGCNTWIAVPFIGYARWDVAVMFLAVEATFIYVSWTRQSVQVVAALFLLFGLPYLPENNRPMMYLNQLGGRRTDQIKNAKLTPAWNGGGVSVNNTGFSQEEAAALVDMTMKYKDRWTHFSLAQAGGYFHFGSAYNSDDREFMYPEWKSYSLFFGFEPSGQRHRYEASFRNFYPDDVDDVQSILQMELAPRLRQVLANTLGVDHDRVVFGNEIGRGPREKMLGMPAIGVVLPHFLWHWIQDPHVDSIFTGVIPKKIPCEKAGAATAFVIPLTAPEGSGLRVWKEEDGNMVMNEVHYEIGNVYSFTWDTIHAIRPLPYFEWKRSSHRINVKGFGVQCDDSKWYIYH